MRNARKWFTLVELIVVITILAILWTVAFLSVQSYSGFARNAIRLDGISKIATIIQTKKQVWINILSFVNPGQEVPNAQIGWEIATPGTNYQAGIINTSALQVKNLDFQDPDTEDLFRAWATLKKWWEYEVVATITDNWTQNSKVSGTYEKRDVEILSGAGLLWGRDFILSNPVDINKLRKWDIVTGTWILADTQIKNISNDWLTLILNNNFTSNWTTIRLWSEETNGLVAGTDWVIPITNDGTVVAYDIINN